MASTPATEPKKIEPAKESDDFDAASDLCDFGFVLTPSKPATETRPENSASS